MNVLYAEPKASLLFFVCCPLSRLTNKRDRRLDRQAYSSSDLAHLSDPRTTNARTHTPLRKIQSRLVNPQV